MLSIIWHDYLFAPLLNLLIYFYDNFAFGNLGIAVIYMTISLRLVLLPFSIVSERDSYKHEKIQQDIAMIGQEFKDDPVERKEHIRALLRANRIHPWPSAILLGVQLLTLVLLYQVFVGGMTGKLTALYDWVPRPDIINTQFLGIDISQRNYYAAGLVGIILFWQIWRQQRQRKDTLDRGDMFFRYGFPIGSFVALAILPSVKTVFILTTMTFSYVLHLFRPFFTRRLQAVKYTALRIHDKIINSGETGHLEKQH